MLAASNVLFAASQENYYIEMLKLNWWAVITIGQLFFRSFAQHYTADNAKLATQLLFPRFPVTNGVMSSSSTTSSSAEYREKRTPPPGKRTGAA